MLSFYDLNYDLYLRCFSRKRKSELLEIVTDLKVDSDQILVKA